MKSRSTSILSIIVFTAVLLLCITVIGIWIYWFLTNSQYYRSIADFISPELIEQKSGIVFFVGGLTSIVLIITGIILIFSRLIRQIEKNNIYNDFMNTVSHELKTPLTSIQLSLETLQHRTLPEKNINDFYNIIAADTVRLGDLIETIIETARLDDDKNVFSPEYIIADETVTRLAEAITSRRHTDSPELSFSGKAASIIQFDVKYLRIILNNLIDNSIKFSEQPAKINICYKARKKKFIMLFSDNGYGIPHKKRKAVFKKFFRLKLPETDTVRGTGLGLYYVKKIIKAFKGRIKIIDTSGGNGTTFEIKFPIIPHNPGEY